MSDDSINKNFGMLLRELLARSSISADEFQEKLAQQITDLPDQQEIDVTGIAPPVAVVSMIIDILSPEPEDRKSLFRALAPLIAADETRPFSELVQVCRLAVGLSLEEAGKKLQARVTDDRFEPGVRIALYEIGILFPTAEEGEALAEILAIPPAEHSVFTNKVATTLQSNLKVVDKNYKPSSGPSEAEIEKARELVKKETKTKDGFIVSETARTLKSLKDKKDK